MTDAKRGIRRFLNHPATEIVIGVLIVASVVLTVMEFAASPSPRWLVVATDAITATFIVELWVRGWASLDRRRFVRDYWIDLVAVLPVFRVFRVARALRLLRVLRLLRLSGVVSRQGTYFPYVLRKGLLEHVAILMFIVLTVVFGTVGMLHFEGRVNARFHDYGRTFWWSLYTLFAGDPNAEQPQTLAGRLITLAVLFMGVGIFAMLTGTVSAFMVQRVMRMGSQDEELTELDRHLIVCGWSPKIGIILRELKAGASGDLPVVVVAQFDDDDELIERTLRRPDVHCVNADFTTMEALDKAGVRQASTAIILSDRRGGRSAQDADARTLLTALTIERMNPRVYTCAELNNRDYGAHLQAGGVNDFVVGGEQSAILLAQAALNRGITGFVTELLTVASGNRFCKLPLPAGWAGRSFDELLPELKRDHEAILVAVEDGQGGAHVNPAHYTFQDGDKIVVIATKPPEL